MCLGHPGTMARARSRVPLHLAAFALIVAVAVVVAGCGSSRHPAAKAAKAVGPTACGTTRTAAHVPVRIQISRGTVSCRTAMTVERDYARAIIDGKAPGNGGGGPVRIDGWTCQGFATPQVLRTGQTSKCVDGSKEILAVLPPT